MSSPSDLLREISTRLQPLLGEVVFLGGCATQLLITDPAAAPVRISDDVDVIVEITSYSAYAKFSRRLRQLGFAEDSSEGAPLCRFRADGMKLDVMPTDERILGFSNRWYKSALKSARTVVFEGLNLRVVTAPYFVATKLEAFKGRGADDVYASKDLEDVISVVDGRPSLLEEISGADTRVRSYIGREFDELMKNRGFLDALPGHVPGDPASQSRVPRIMRAMRALARIAPVRGTKLVAKRGTGRPRRQ